MDNPKIDWLDLHVNFHKVHADAGWKPISEQEIKDRFVFYHKWLASKDLTVAECDSINKSFILYKNQVTVKGWKFLPKVHDKFISLMVPNRTVEQDASYLDKRYKQLIGDVI